MADIQLTRISPARSPSHTTVSPNDVGDTEVDRNSVQNESLIIEATPERDRPTRRYQLVLLLAGFMMIFQTIGISQSYGIFQVYRCLLCIKCQARHVLTRDPHLLVIASRNSILPRKVISSMVPDKNLLWHLLVPSVAG